jgi:uroporphyrinogen decarboxylase
MGMNKRERMGRALRREPVDRLPTQVNYTGAMGEKLAAHLGVSPAELPGRLGKHAPAGRRRQALL